MLLLNSHPLVRARWRSTRGMTYDWRSSWSTSRSGCSSRSRCSRIEATLSTPHSPRRRSKPLGSRWGCAQWSHKQLVSCHAAARSSCRPALTLKGSGRRGPLSSPLETCVRSGPLSTLKSYAHTGPLSISKAYIYTCVVLLNHLCCGSMRAFCGFSRSQANCYDEEAEEDVEVPTIAYR